MALSSTVRYCCWLKNLRMTSGKLIRVSGAITGRGSRPFQLGTPSPQKDRRRSDHLGKFLKKTSKKEMLNVHDVWHDITITEWAQILKIKPGELRELLLRTPFANEIGKNNEPLKNPNLFKEIAKLLRVKFRVVASPNRIVKTAQTNLDVKRVPIDEKNLVPRPPIVALVGHVDHGKTTLLDYLRKSSIVDAESGGITQHIGVFTIELNGQKVTFLDTPGHAAFKTMRQRGTNVTDIVILLVDAVEGPLEQTFESLRAIRRSRVNYIVAISKIDRAGADVERVKQKLKEEGQIELEEFGGDIPCVPISALKGQNIGELIETVLAQAEVLQLSGDPKGPVEAAVVESNIEHGLGKSTTVLVKRGTLKKGQFLVAGTTYARVKVLLQTRPALSTEGASREELKSVGPSFGCKIYGWKDLPASGTEILQVEDERRAKEVVNWRQQQESLFKMEADKEAIGKKRTDERQVYVNQRIQKLQLGKLKVRYGRHGFERQKESIIASDKPKLTILIKTDFDGTRDAILTCLETYNAEDAILDVIDVTVGDVSESDVKVCHEFDGLLYTFNCGASDGVRRTASLLQVPLKQYNIIYKMFDDIKAELSNILAPEDYESQIGKGIVLEEFLINEKRKKVPVAGARVNQGILDKSKLYKVLRNEEVIHRGSLESLRHLKEEISNIGQGQECGIRLKDTSVRFEAGDVIICYEIKSRFREIDWDPFF